MILLTLAWSLLMASQASDVNLILEQDKPVALYPDLFSEALIHCTDGNLQPDAVYWFRTLLPAAAAAARAQFLGKLNKAEVFSPGEGVSRDRFKSKKKTKNVFWLKIINVTEEDAGLYSCVMKDRKATEVWKPGVLLLPGVIPPTSPPTTTTRATVRHICRCSPRDGCGPLVLWPLVGTAAALALTLLCTLYYFSRLPKKCRHRFVKKRQLT